MKFKKLMPFFISVAIISLLVGCGNTGSTSSKNTEPLSKDEIEQMYSNPDSFKGRTVELYGKVFADPEKDDKGTYFQAFADPENSSKNTLIKVNDSNLDVKNGDIIHVTGKIEKKFEGENALGGKVIAPVITAEKFEKSNYAEAFSPAIKTIDLDKEIDQHGYVLKLNKVEIANDETRVYLTITNNTKEEIKFYSFNSKLTQGSNQISDKDNYDAQYKRIQSEIMPGVKEEGIVLFKKVDPAGDNLNLHFEGSSDNYDLDFKPFTFNVELN